jgi:predicted metal-dependent phosphoesterase TrpH
LNLSYDLHTHSLCSDGKLSPEELVSLAKVNNVNVLALTDHDTIDGIPAAILAAGDELTIIPGIEVSTLWQGRGIHIVGLQIDIHSGELQQAVSKQADIRLERAKTIAIRLEKAGIKGAWEGAQQYAQGAAIGRPHFAQHIIDGGYAANFAQAFKRYLGAGKVGDVKNQWPSIASAISWINAAGGIAVVAHPDKYGLTRTKLYALLQEFADAGGKGIEVVSGNQNLAVTQKLQKAATDFSLLASCGSDFHSPDNKWQSPGVMSPLPNKCQAIWDFW